MSPSQEVLGVVLDSSLRLEEQTTLVTGVLANTGRALAASFADLGLGVPFLCEQFDSRVLGKALSGVELLSSAAIGFRAVMERLNSAQYLAAKAFLGLPANVSVGSRVAVLSETRLLTRAGTEAAMRVVMARARLACLPEEHPVYKVAWAVWRARVGGTWMEDSSRVMREVLGIDLELWEFEAVSLVVRNTRRHRKALLARYKRHVVLPRVRAKESEWFRDQLAKLNTEGAVPYHELVPVRARWQLALQCAPWGATLWRFFRAWALARITGGIPLSLWGMGDIASVLPRCFACGEN